MSIVLELAMRSGCVSIEAAYEYVSNMQTRQVLTDEGSVEMLGDLLDQWTLQKLFGHHQLSGADESRAADWESSPHNKGQTHDRYGFKIDTDQPELYIHACTQEARRSEVNDRQLARWRTFLDSESPERDVSSLVRA